MKDFFISYNHRDEAQAMWIDAALKEAGYTTIIQAHDFAPGSNFALEMQKGAAACSRTIAVLSPDYLASQYTAAEWAAAFGQDPTGAQRKLIPVRVRACDPSGMLAAIVHIDLTKPDEDEAAQGQRLLEGIEHALKTAQPTPVGVAARDAAPPVQAPEAKPPAQPIWHVPYHRNNHFTGREEVLTALRAQLEASGSAAITQVLHGLGGIGKTQTALEYCYRHRTAYKLVGWLPAEEKAPLLQAYADLAVELRLPTAPDQRQQIDAVGRWLAQHEGWLLIFDNAEGPEAIAELIPTNSAGHVLITARNPLWGGLAKPLALPVLPRVESVAFIIKRLEKATPAEADELAALVGDLPLALAQAVGYSEAAGKTVGAYSALFRQQQAQMLAKKGGPLDYAGSVATAWALALERLQMDKPLAVQLLTLCAYLAPDAIPRDLLQAYVAEKEGEAQSEFALDEALMALRRYSLLNVDEGVVAIHRLVQAVVRQRLPKKRQRRWAQEAVALMRRLLPADAATPATWPRWAALLPHALAATELAQTASPGAVVAVLARVGAYLVHAGAYGAAQETLQQALAACRAADLTPLTEAALLQRLADACWQSGAFSKAYDYAQAALRGFVAACAPDDLRIAGARIVLAQCAVQRGAWAAAREAASLALQRVEAVADEADLDEADLNNLAVVYDQLSDHDTALRLYQRALTLDERRYGAAHPQYITTLGNIGTTLYRMRRLPEARDAAVRALDLAATLYPPDHLHLAALHHALGLVLADLDNFVAARAAFEKALSIKQKAMGSAHADVAVTLGNLGVVLTRSGHLAQAIDYLAQALAITEAAHDPAHPEVARALYHLADAYLAAGDVAAAKGHAERALQIDLQHYAEESEQVQSDRRRLAAIQAALDQQAQPKGRRRRRP